MLENDRFQEYKIITSIKYCVLNLYLFYLLFQKQIVRNQFLTFICNNECSWCRSDQGEQLSAIRIKELYQALCEFYGNKSISTIHFRTLFLLLNNIFYCDFIQIRCAYVCCLCSHTFTHIILSHTKMTKHLVFLWMYTFAIETHSKWFIEIHMSMISRFIKNDFDHHHHTLMMSTLASVLSNQFWSDIILII